MVQERKDTIHRWVDSILLSTAVGIMGWVALKQYDTNARVVRLETIIEQYNGGYIKLSERVTDLEHNVAYFRAWVDENYERKHK